MKLAKRRFIRDTRDEGSWSSGGGELCRPVLESMFSIPDDVSVIWITLHCRPAANRVAVRVVGFGRGSPVAIAEHQQDRWDRAQRTVDQSAFEKLLRPLIGRTVYAAVEYDRQ